VPQDNVISKYYFKAKDGLRHATIFTMRAEPQVIKMHEDGQKVVQKNCQTCHAALNEQVGLTHQSFQDTQCDDSKLCWDCHREVPHGRIHGLDATPFSRVPMPESAVPQWLRDYTDLNNNEND
jgi:cytochrome c nitrite reductase small subunit